MDTIEGEGGRIMLTTSEHRSQRFGQKQSSQWSEDSVQDTCSPLGYGGSIDTLCLVARQAYNEL